MTDYRRKKFYIDSIFQKKFLFLFLFLSFLASVANIFYSSIFLKKEVESNLYRSRIVISNVNEIIVNNVAVFNIFMLIIMILLSFVFYYLVRRRVVKYFINELQKSLYMRKKCVIKEKLNIELPEEFYELNKVLAEFFSFVDRRLKAENEIITMLEEFTNNPVERTKQKATEKLSSLPS